MNAKTVCALVLAFLVTDWAIDNERRLKRIEKQVAEIHEVVR
ncbi:MAG: hypothetical protein ACJAZW_002002 [Maritalea sp.]|jgi:hypothetical protein